MLGHAVLRRLNNVNPTNKTPAHGAPDYSRTLVMLRALGSD